MVEKIVDGISITTDYHTIAIWPINFIFKFKPISIIKLDHRRVPITIFEDKQNKRVSILYKHSYNRYKFLGYKA